MGCVEQLFAMQAFVTATQDPHACCVLKVIWYVTAATGLQRPVAKRSSQASPITLLCCVGSLWHKEDALLGCLSRCLCGPGTAEQYPVSTAGREKQSPATFTYSGKCTRHQEKR